MAAYVPVPRDLSRVKSKIFFNLTKRQLICFGTAALLGVPSYFFLKNIFGNSLAAFCMIVIMLPLFLLGMYEKDGEPLEKVLTHFIKATWIRPKIRPYQTNNYYAALLRQARARKEVEAIVFAKEISHGKGGKETGHSWWVRWLLYHAVQQMYSPRRKFFLRCINMAFGIIFSLGQFILKNPSIIMFL